MKRVALLGSTGSIGQGTLSVLARHSDRFRVHALAAEQSAELLARQVRRFQPELAVLGSTEASAAPLEGVDGPVLRGREAVLDLCRDPDVDIVVNAIVGSAGLEPTLVALGAGKRLALANKESLVAGGELVMAALRDADGELVPIDSEHSAILQCLEGYDRTDLARIVLTASGGPLRGWTHDDVRAAGPGDALRHPTWEMGAKITVDSATLANKALEVIEAHVLYGIGYDDIDVVVHPQSIIHSFVEFLDGSVLAQLGFPTMELPILIALCYPERVPDPVLRTFDPLRSSPLTFEPVDHAAFPLFQCGVAAGRAGGTAPAVFNAANEVAVRGFLDGEIRLGAVADIVQETLDLVEPGAVERLEDVLRADREARVTARRLLEINSSTPSLS